MVTKTLNKLLFMMVIVMTTISVFADPGASGSQNTQGNGQAVLLLQYKAPRTKRMPSRTFRESELIFLMKFNNFQNKIWYIK